MLRSIRVQHEDFDAALESAKLTQGRTDIGAVVTFAGLCRDEGGKLAALELEHYPGMGKKRSAVSLIKRLNAGRSKALPSSIASARSNPAPKSSWSSPPHRIASLLLMPQLS